MPEGGSRWPAIGPMKGTSPAAEARSCLEGPEPEDQGGYGHQLDHHGGQEALVVVMANMRCDRKEEVGDESDRGCDADRTPEEAEDQSRRASEENDREVVELALRHPDPGITLHDVFAVRELPNRRE